MRTRARVLHLKTDIQIGFLEKLVFPVLLYGCEVWCYGDLKPNEIFCSKILKRQLAVADSTEPESPGSVMLTVWLY